MSSIQYFTTLIHTHKAVVGIQGSNIIALGFYNENPQNVLSDILGDVALELTSPVKSHLDLDSYFVNINALRGTLFQKKVWKTLLEIPKGQTVSYKDIAEKIHHPKAHRAVGTAVGKNPISYIIPCHRVLPVSGRVGNYRWGASIKESLLTLET